MPDTIDVQNVEFEKLYSCLKPTQTIPAIRTVIQTCRTVEVLSIDTLNAIADALDVFQCSDDSKVFVNRLNSSLTISISNEDSSETKTLTLQASSFPLSVHLRTPELRTPFTETPAHMSLTIALTELETGSTQNLLRSYTSLIVPLIAGHGFGRTRLMLNKFYFQDNSHYFSFTILFFYNTDSFPKASTAWRCRFTPTTSFFEGVYYVVGLISTIFGQSSPKENFVDNSKDYHLRIITKWKELSRSKETELMAQIQFLVHFIHHTSKVRVDDFQEGAFMLLLDEVDSLVDTRIENNLCVWDCLVIAVRLIQRKFAESDDHFHCVVALSPSSLSTVHPGQRPLPVSSMDDDSDIPNRWMDPISDFFPIFRPSVAETDFIDSVSLDVLVSGRPKWGQYLGHELSGDSPQTLKTNLWMNARKFVTNCLNLNQQNSDTWIGAALNYILIPEQLMATATKEYMKLSSFSLVNVHPENRMVTLYRPSDVLLTTSIWSIVEQYDDTELVSSLLQHILPRPFDEQRFGVAVENVAMMLILRTIRDTEASNVSESYWRTISVKDFLAKLAQKEEEEVMEEDAEAKDQQKIAEDDLNDWILGGVQVETFSSHQFQGINWNFTLFKAFLCRSILLPPPRMKGIDFVIHDCESRITERIASQFDQERWL
ncbi:hypothetical protein GEMRC1_003798 [Eukaryota sp. GEM-RC1]